MYRNDPQCCDDPPKYPQFHHTLKYSFFWKRQKYWNSKFWPPQMVQAYLYMKISEYPPHPPGVWLLKKTYY